MDPSILNALIFDYVSKKDKVLATTLKNKLKAVSTMWSFLELSEIKPKMSKKLRSTFHAAKNAFSENLELTACLAILMLKMDKVTQFKLFSLLVQTRTPLLKVARRSKTSLNTTRNTLPRKSPRSPPSTPMTLIQMKMRMSQHLRQMERPPPLMANPLLMEMERNRNQATKTTRVRTKNQHPK